VLPKGNGPTTRDHAIAVAGAGDFASTLACRYLDRGSSWVTLDTIWRRFPAPLVVSPVTQRIDLRVTPRISIQAFAPLQTRDVRVSAHGTVQTTLARADSQNHAGERESSPDMAMRSPIEPRHLRHEEVASVEPLHPRREVMSVVQRLLERERRVDATTHRSGLREAADPALVLPFVAAQVPEPHHQQQPAVQVLRRPQPAPPLSENAPVPPPSTGEPLHLATRDQDRSLHAASPAQQPAPIDLADLTDRVVQAIDRRVVAQRERMGRW
jgi:hypothetical protein